MAGGRRDRVRVVRTRVFVGCEGESERAYAAWIQSIADALGLHLSIDPVLTGGGGGDPESIVRRRIMEMRRREQLRGVYEHRAILLDNDTAMRQREKRDQAIRIAAEHGVILLWQDPDHEGLLLRHCSGCATHRPVAGGDSTRRLRIHWPEYEKPADRIALFRRFSIDDLKRLSGQEVELVAFLRGLGFDI